MNTDKRRLVAVLRGELEFLEKGGYRKHSWRPRFIFEDSPTCLNYRDDVQQHECAECPLMQLVPPEHRSDGVPCRYIPLNRTGETVANLYRWAEPNEIEVWVAIWLRKKIAALEKEVARDEKAACA